MSMIRKNQGGYIGIISLLIVFLIITFLLIRPDVFTGNPKTKGTLETGLDAVEQAKQIAGQSNKQNSTDLNLEE